MPIDSKKRCKEIMKQARLKGYENQSTMRDLKSIIQDVCGLSNITAARYFEYLTKLGYIENTGAEVFTLHHELVGD